MQGFLFKGERGRLYKVHGRYHYVCVVGMVSPLCTCVCTHHAYVMCTALSAHVCVVSLTLSLCVSVLCLSLGPVCVCVCAQLCLCTCVSIVCVTPSLCVHVLCLGLSPVCARSYVCVCAYVQSELLFSVELASPRPRRAEGLPGIGEHQGLSVAVVLLERALLLGKKMVITAVSFCSCLGDSDHGPWEPASHGQCSPKIECLVQGKSRSCRERRRARGDHDSRLVSFFFPFFFYY